MLRTAQPGLFELCCRTTRPLQQILCKMNVMPPSESRGSCHPLGLIALQEPFRKIHVPVLKPGSFSWFSMILHCFPYACEISWLRDACFAAQCPYWSHKVDGRCAWKCPAFSNASAANASWPSFHRGDVQCHQQSVAEQIHSWNTHKQKQTKKRIKKTQEETRGNKKTKKNQGEPWRNKNKETRKTRKTSKHKKKQE